MQRLCEVLRSGAWLTRERIRIIAVAVLVASIASFLFLIVTANGLIDRQGRPLGTDFSNVYAAGTFVLEGKPEAPLDLRQQRAREQKLFGGATPFYGWHYPPIFLFVAAALALLPYASALAAGQAVTLAFYLWTIRAIVFRSALWRKGQGEAGLSHQRDSDRPHSTAQGTVDLSPLARSDWLLLAVAFPAVLVNIGHGQNGFLTAALLGAALIQLDRRPLLAGALFGLLAYKPQFGLMIPVVLAASGRWRPFAAAAATVAALTGATMIAFGPHVWQAFFDSARFTRLVALEQGDTGWYKIQSIFAWARMWGAPIPLAYALQGALIVALAGALAWLWRGRTSYPLQAAALCLSAILATPYSFDYDMMVLAPAIAFFAADGLASGFRPWEKTALAAAWLMPLVARTAAHATFIPLGVPAMLVVFVLLLRRSTFHFSFPGASPRTFVLK